MKLPTREEAEELLKDAEKCNPGPRADHSREVAKCAEKIADGYDYMMEAGYEDIARICLTHSFHIKDIETYVGNRDVAPEQFQKMGKLLQEINYDDYDRLIQFCDCLALNEGPVLIEKRLIDVAFRYGIDAFTVEKWKKIFGLKKYFEEKAGDNIYKIVTDNEKLWEQ